MAQDQPRTIADLVYVSFNSQVAALDRFTGEKIWSWKSPKGSGFVAMLIEIDRLIVSCQGYTYCLDPLFGQEVWSNPLEGMGVGIPCLASVNGISAASTMMVAAGAEVRHQEEQAASSTAVVSA